MKERDKLRDTEGRLYDFSNIKTQGWLDGHLSGLDAAFSFLKRRAAQLFDQDKHEEALELKRLVNEMVEFLEPGMHAAAARHEKEHPALIEEEEEEE